LLPPCAYTRDSTDMRVITIRKSRNFHDYSRLGIRSSNEHGESKKKNMPFPAYSLSYPSNSTDSTDKGVIKNDKSRKFHDYSKLDIRSSNEYDRLEQVITQGMEKDNNAVEKTWIKTSYFSISTGSTDADIPKQYKCNVPDIYHRKMIKKKDSKSVVSQDAYRSREVGRTDERTASHKGKIDKRLETDQCNIPHSFDMNMTDETDSNESTSQQFNFSSKEKTDEELKEQPNARYRNAIDERDSDESVSKLCKCPLKENLDIRLENEQSSVSNADDRHMIDKRGSNKSVSHQSNPSEESIGVRLKVQCSISTVDDKSVIERGSNESRSQNFNDSSKESIEERLEKEDCRIFSADGRGEINSGNVKDVSESLNYIDYIKFSLAEGSREEGINVSLGKE